MACLSPPHSLLDDPAPDGDKLLMFVLAQDPQLLQRFLLCSPTLSKRSPRLQRRSQNTNVNLRIAQTVIQAGDLRAEKSELTKRS